MSNESIISFNSGELSPKLDVRVDVEKYRSGCRRLENFIPEKYGCATKRPGLKFIKDSSTAPNNLPVTTVRMIPFIYSSSIAYKIEVGNKYMRFYYGDAVLEDEDSDEVWISTPYLEEHIFELKYKQIGDVMRITHPNYCTKLLSRTGAYAFTLTDAPFRKGPFLTRNDLVDPDNQSTTTLSCTATLPGLTGMLSANTSMFLAGHKGALFKLSHARTLKSETFTGTGATKEGSVFHGKGTYNLLTRGTWTGKIVWQRREGSGDWEELFSYSSSTDAYQNVNKSYVEESDTTEHRLYTDNANNKLKADFSIDEPLEAGIVKILAVINPYQASCEVYSKLSSTDATVKWSEGAWSDSRGHPATVAFFEDRCVYSGAARSLTDSEFSTTNYPALRL